MGPSLSCFRQSSPQRLSDQEEIKLHDDHNQSNCFMMVPCLWTKETKEKQLQQQQLKEKQELTLEDWLIASPGLQKINGASGGEYHVFKNSSKRVFPSFVGENTNSSSKPRESFSKERLLKAEEDVESHQDISRSQSGKSKKRVSFRLPEESDIFIFHSSSSSSSSPGEEESE